MYQVRRASDNATQDIAALAAGCPADAAAQDAFCGGTACVVARIYDQTPHRNHLHVSSAPPERTNKITAACGAAMAAACGAVRQTDGDSWVQCCVTNYAAQGWRRPAGASGSSGAVLTGR